MKQTIAMLFFFVLALVSCQENGNFRKDPLLTQERAQQVTIHSDSLDRQTYYYTNKTVDWVLEDLEKKNKQLHFDYSTRDLESTTMVNITLNGTLGQFLDSLFRQQHLKDSTVDDIVYIRRIPEFRITMNLKSADVRAILPQIQSQTGLGIVGLPGALDGAKKLSINVKNKPLITFLEDYCKVQPFNFQIEKSNSLVIRRKTPSELPVCLKVKDANVHDVLKIIRKQTEIGLSYPPELLDGAKILTITVTNMPLDSVMGLVCKGQRFTYSIYADRLLILKPLH